MRVFARIEDGVVRELHATEQDVAEKFHAALRWVEVTGQEIAEGLRETEQGFVRPVESVVAAVVPTVASLQAELAALSARIASLV